MDQMELERKYLVEECNLPKNLDSFQSHLIEQGYLCRNPVLRIRRQDDTFILTYKALGYLAREEYNLPLNAEAYAHLKEKIDGSIISKRRYLLPLDDVLTVELDVFSPPHQGLYLAEVEFPSLDALHAFRPPAWFGEDVSQDGRYQNSTLSL